MHSVSLHVEQANDHDRLQAALTMRNGTQRTFLVETSQRYPVKSLQHTMRQVGWAMLHRQPFDGEKRSVFLFEKM